MTQPRAKLRSAVATRRPGPDRQAKPSEQCPPPPYVLSSCARRAVSAVCLGPLLRRWPCMEACAYVCCKWRHSRHQAAEVAEVIVHDLTENIRLKNASAATQWPAMTLAYSRQGFELLTSLFFELLAANARWAATAEDTVHGKAFARHMLRCRLACRGSPAQHGQTAS